MITAKLNGGLGNKMFQVAVTASLAMDNKDDFAFDLNDTVVHQGNPANTYKSTIFRDLKELPQGWKPSSVFTEQSPQYSPVPFKQGMEIRGYFQSEKYFLNNKDKIVAMFRHEPTINMLIEKYKDILEDSVSLHIRRGDYVTIGNAREIGYFYRATNILWEEVKTENLLIFSDDIEWCKANFYNAPYIHFIEGQKDYEDLYLMSLCDHNITDMSSFSWWGSYLNFNKDKRVLMPGKLSEAHTSDFYFDGVNVIQE